MEVFSLSGASGTGKSTVALSFAHEKKIPAIIDDGLLIFNGQKIAGTSAKFEKNAITAVKRATFLDEYHKKEVQFAIGQYYIDRILIIGTSDRMVRLIAKNLELGDIKHFYHIEDVRSSSEIKIAQYVRKTEGKHVIPIPYKQVEQNFFKKLIHRGMDIFSPQKERIGETTMVYPDFHKGTIKIYKNVFKEIVEYVCTDYIEIKGCKSISVHLKGLPVLKLSIILKFPINYSLIELGESIQQKIQEQFRSTLNIEFFSIDIEMHISPTGKSQKSQR